MACSGIGNHGDLTTHDDFGSVIGQGDDNGDKGGDGQFGGDAEAATDADSPCASLSAKQCRSARGTCDWCRWVNTCAVKDQCPGGKIRSNNDRRSPELPDPSELSTCACTST